MSYKYYSPLGFLSIDPNIIIINFNYNQPHEKCFNFNPDKLRTDKTNIVIMNSHPASIQYFAVNILPLIPYRFVIISFCCDTTFPIECNGWSEKERLERGNNYETIVNNKHFVHWFATNKITQNDGKTTGIPYGLNYWVLELFSAWGSPIKTASEQDECLCKISSDSLHFTKRITKIYANWHLNKTDSRFGNYRTRLQTIIPSHIIYYDVVRSRDDYWRECSKYAFVISPHGNGLDCIRTWESLCLGCIVIVKKSKIDYLYNNLPVLIVNDWTDITEELLQNTLNDFSKKEFNMESITMDYWLEKVKLYLA